MDSNKFDVNYFIYTPDFESNLAYISFEDENNDKELTFEKLQDGYKVKLNGSMPSYTIKVESVYIGQIVPAVKKRTQEENQTLIYSGNLYYYSPYKTLFLKSYITLKLMDDLQLTHKPKFYDRNRILYHAHNILPYSFEMMRISFKNTIQLLVALKLDRVIDVSHFGKILINECIEIKNEDAELVGPYRVLLQPRMDWWYTDLPLSAEDIKLFDVIGNNSKSEIMYSKTYKTLKFQSRYPLWNGWKTSYNLQYHVPTYEYLFGDGNNFDLIIKAINHVHTDVLIRNAKIKIILPEGAEIRDLLLPNGFTRLPNEKSYTNLVTFGRPTVVFVGSNLVEDHFEEVELRYVFNKKHMFRIPVLLAAYIQAIFLMIIAIISTKIAAKI